MFYISYVFQTSFFTSTCYVMHILAAVFSLIYLSLKTKFENCNTVIEMWPSVVHITTMRNGEK